MRVTASTAQQATRPFDGTRAPVRRDVRYEALNAEATPASPPARPVPLVRTDSNEAARHHTERDLGAARGVVTAAALGAGIWGLIIALVYVFAG